VTNKNTKSTRPGWLDMLAQGIELKSNDIM